MTGGRGRPAADRLYGAYLFDLDGTIYLGDELLPGAERLVRALRERDLPVRFLSNNPTKDPEQYAAKLDGLGLPTPVTEIVNTVVTMTRWLLDNAPDAVVYPISEPPLLRALEAAGIRTSSDPAEIDIVVASYDRSFTYEKLQIAFDAIWYHQRARLVATNPDRFCPFPGGRGEPDCAAITAAVEACTGVRCEATVGKPDPAMLHAALAGLRRGPGRLRDGRGPAHDRHPHGPRRRGGGRPGPHRRDHRRRGPAPGPARHPRAGARPRRPAAAPGGLDRAGLGARAEPLNLFGSVAY